MGKQTVGVPTGQMEARACGGVCTAVGRCLYWVQGEWGPSGEFTPCFHREHEEKAAEARAEAASWSVGQALFAHDCLPSTEAAALRSASSFSG